MSAPTDITGRPVRWAVTDAVAGGCTEHEWMPLDETLLVQGLMEDALHALGVNHADPDL